MNKLLLIALSAGLTHNACAMEKSTIVFKTNVPGKPEINYNLEDMQARFNDIIKLKVNGGKLKVVNIPSKQLESKYLALNDKEYDELNRSILSCIAALDYSEDENSDDVFFHLDTFASLPVKVLLAQHEAVTPRATITLECAGFMYRFDEDEFRNQLQALKKMPIDNIQLANETLSPEQKEQVRQSLLSHIAVLQRFSNNNEYLVIDRKWLTPLPELTKTTAAVTSAPIHPTLIQKVLNPTTLTVGALCAIGAWYAAKHNVQQ